MSTDCSIYGSIKCVLCDVDKTIRISSKRANDDEKIYWIFSNFQKHLNIEHKILFQKSNTTRRTSNKKTKQTNTSLNQATTSQNKIAASRTEVTKIDKRKAEKIVEAQNESELNEPKDKRSLNELQFQDEEYSDDQTDFKDTTTIELEISTIYAPAGSFENLETNIYEQISKQTLEMTAICFHYKGVKKMKFDHMDVVCNLDVINIPPDGNCLFGAFVHQIFGYKPSSKIHEDMVIKLRSDVVNYIKSNLEIFEKDLKGRIIAKKAGKLPKRQKIKIENFEKEVEDFLSDLSKDGIWGGSETIRAVSLMHKLNILVINEGGTIFFANGFKSDYKKTIMIAFRLNEFYGKMPSSGEQWNHYDSVIDITTENVLKIAEALAHHISNQTVLSNSIVCLDD